MQNQLFLLQICYTSFIPEEGVVIGLVKKENNKGLPRDCIHLCFLNFHNLNRFTDYLTGNPFFSFLGDNMVNETVETLLEFSKKENLKFVVGFKG